MAESVPRGRSCGGAGLRSFLSLGETPLADALLAPDDLADPEPRYPLDVALCPDCTLVQILGEVPPQTLFVDNNLYFSSTTSSCSPGTSPTRSSPSRTSIEPLRAG